MVKELRGVCSSHERTELPCMRCVQVLMSLRKDSWDCWEVLLQQSHPEMALKPHVAARMQRSPATG